jgi:DNA-binding MarR family transcriptional regulator
MQLMHIQMIGASKEMARREQVNLAEVSACTCLGLRRTTRRVTRLYDDCLAPAAVTVGQFGVLARLYGVKLLGKAGLSLGALAELLGMDPTTLTRNLRPMLAGGLVQGDRDPADRRALVLSLTKKGEQRLIKATPLWREAQKQVEAALGDNATQSLGRLLGRLTKGLGGG